jgi:hypothetical protein
VDCFIRDYVQAINNGRAAVFAGAGMSMPSGYVNWKNLMHDIAKHLGLDVDKESDLTAVAQYYLNDQHRRTRLNQLLVDEFAGAAGPSENHKLIVKRRNLLIHHMVARGRCSYQGDCPYAASRKSS